MTKSKEKCAPSDVAAQIRRKLRTDGSAKHAKGVQSFYKEEIESYGWYTAPLRKAARRSGREILKEHGSDF